MERIQKVLGEYRLLARLATGGQSEVFLAARGGPHGFFRPVVIKALPEEFKGKRKFEALFYQEATVSSRLSHPHVVTIHDVRRVDNEHFMVMDYVAGQTVADLAGRAFSQGEGLTLDEALLIVADAARGLDYVHCFEDVDRQSYEIVHCDMSPQNLMVTYSGVTRVFDFGISQVLGESGALKSDLVGGKFAYMSPEQCRGEKVDARSDVFSLGIILYELVTGRRLFRRKGSEAVIRAIVEEPIAAPSQVAEHLDEGIDAVVMRALARERSDRYQSAGEFQAAVEGLIQGRVDEIRRSMGQKVATLFDDERQEISKLLREASLEMSEQIYTSAAAGPSEREIELEEDLGAARAELGELNVKAQRATEVAEVLTHEVTRLQRREKWFVIALCVLSLVTVAIAAATHLMADPVAEAQELVAEDP